MPHRRLVLALSLRLRLQKLQKVDQQIENYKQVPHHVVGVGVNIAVNHHLHLLRAEREWLQQVIAELAHHNSI